MTDDLRRFKEWSFPHACGKLDSGDAAWMETMMAAHPDLREHFAQDLLLASQAREALASQPASAPLHSFESIMAAVHQRQRPSPWRLEWLRKWWQAPLPAGWAVACMAGLAVLGSVQTYRLDMSRQEIRQDDAYRSLSRATPAALPTLKVVFDDKISAGDLRALLFELKLDVVRGPDEQGAYWLSVTEGQPEQALEHLRGSKMVLDAYDIKARP